jgi:hypothetical protein
MHFKLTFPPVEEDPSDESIRRGSLTFYLNQPEAKKDDSPLSAADDPAELMRWHYHASYCMANSPYLFVT